MWRLPAATYTRCRKADVRRAFPKPRQSTLSGPFWPSKETTAARERAVIGRRASSSPSGDPHRADHDAECETRSVVLLRHYDLSCQRDTRLDAGDDDRLARG